MYSPSDTFLHDPDDAVRAGSVYGRGAAVYRPLRPRVVMHDSQWIAHIPMGHGEMVEQLAAVERTIVAPTQINFDQRNPNGENFYLFAVLPPPLQQSYLKVCVRYTLQGTYGPWRGDHRLWHERHQASGGEEMAVSEPRVFQPRWSSHREQRLAFNFNRTSDTLMLMVDPLAFQQVAVSVPISDFEYIRVDANTEETIGFQVEDFLAHAVYVNPVYLDFAVLVEEIEPEELARIRRAASERQAQMDVQERQQELLTVMMGGLRQRIDVA